MNIKKILLFNSLLNMNLECADGGKNPIHHEVIKIKASTNTNIDLGVKKDISFLHTLMMVSTHDKYANGNLLTEAQQQEIKKDMEKIDKNKDFDLFDSIINTNPGNGIIKNYRGFVEIIRILLEGNQEYKRRSEVP